MSKPEILVVRSDPTVTDLVNEYLEEYRVPYEVIGHGATMPPSDRHDGAIIMGSSASPTDPGMSDGLGYTQSRLAEGRPTLGICYGMQAIVAAAGGSVVDSPKPEFGFWGDDPGAPYSAKLTVAGKQDELFRLLGDTIYPLIQLHKNTVDLTGTEVIKMAHGNGLTQAVRIGKSWGVQFHPELTESRLLSWMETEQTLKGVDKDQALGFYMQKAALYRFVASSIICGFVDQSKS